MAYTYTADEFLADVSTAARFTEGQTNYPPEYILSLADDQIHNMIAPVLKGLNEGFFIEKVDGAFVANQQDYTLPEYAMWNALRRIDLIDGDVIKKIDRVEIDEFNNFSLSETGTPRAFCLNHDTVSFFPIPAIGLTQTYRMHIWRRPGALVQTSKAAKIQSVNYATGQVTYTAVPPSTFTASSTHDFYSSKSPFRRIGTAITATAIAANVQTFPIAAVAPLLAGDYVCIKDDTVFLPFPLELKLFLQELVVKMISQERVDPEQYQIERAEILDRMNMALKSPGQRVWGQPKRLKISANRLFRIRRF